MWRAAVDVSSLGDSGGGGPLNPGLTSGATRASSLRDSGKEKGGGLVGESRT